MLRWVALVFFIVGTLLGCQLALLPPTTPTSSPHPLASPSTTGLKRDPEARLPDLSLPDSSAGRLAYLGSDGNVYVTTASLTPKIAVTQDATAAPEYPGYSYHRLSWSPDGRLAFAGVTRSGGETRSVLYIVEAPDRPAQVVGQSDEHFVIYIHWSPVPCPNRPDCQRLAYLIEEEGSIGLRLVEMEEGKIENRRLGVGWPFYFSWAPDGQQMVWHTGGARRYNEAARLIMYDLERDYLRELPHEPGLFVAPAWSPQGDRWLGVSAEAELDSLQSFGVDQPITLKTFTNGQMVFAWSPEGDRVAYAVREKPSDPFYSAVYLFEVQSGETRRITDVGFRILGFFWSPDGQRLAYLTHQPLFDSVWMQWRVYHLAEGRDRGFKMFQPSFQMRFIVSSFNQYVQSDRFWSPDSRYLVYADRDQTLVERVWLIDTWTEDGSQAILIDEGAIGLWSWN
jgi:dipeptidyl aminopeptidase/acylaminoacyl peptidase